MSVDDSEFRDDAPPVLEVEPAEVGEVEQLGTASPIEVFRMKPGKGWAYLGTVANVDGHKDEILEVYGPGRYLIEFKTGSGKSRRKVRSQPFVLGDEDDDADEDDDERPARPSFGRGGGLAGALRQRSYGGGMGYDDGYHAAPSAYQRTLPRGAFGGEGGASPGELSRLRAEVAEWKAKAERLEDKNADLRDQVAKAERALEREQVERQREKDKAEFQRQLAELTANKGGGLDDLLKLQLARMDKDAERDQQRLEREQERFERMLKEGKSQADPMQLLLDWKKAEGDPAKQMLQLVALMEKMRNLDGERDDGPWGKIAEALGPVAGALVRPEPAPVPGAHAPNPAAAGVQPQAQPAQIAGPTEDDMRLLRRGLDAATGIAKAMRHGASPEHFAGELQEWADGNSCPEVLDRLRATAPQTMLAELQQYVGWIDDETQRELVGDLVKRGQTVPGNQWLERLRVALTPQQPPLAPAPSPAPAQPGGATP